MGRDTTASKRMASKRSREKAAGLRRLNVAVDPEVFEKLSVLMKQHNCTSQASLIEVLVMHNSITSPPQKTKESAKMDELLSICDRYQVPVIEDAAESLGATYKGKASGTFGKFGVYSFNGNKIITTSGGGMLISDDEQALQKARFLATQSRDQAPHYQHSKIGYNYRMSNILAGIGRGQLEVLALRVEARRRIFKTYKEQLAHLPGIHFMPELENTRSNRWLTALTVDEKEAGVSISALLKTMAEQNIEARPVWKPLHLQPLFEGTTYYSHSENGKCI